MKIKICGMTRQQDLDYAVSLGFDFCGFIFHKSSPRYVAPATVARFATGSMLRTGVFVEQNAEEIIAIMREAKLDFAQLHGDHTPADAIRIGPERVIRTFWPRRYAEAAELAYACAAFPCSAVLLDAGRMGGGSGECLAWEELNKVEFTKPWFLAGGLSGRNIETALRSCTPAGLDFNSALETSPGCKDPARMMLVMEALQDISKSNFI